MDLSTAGETREEAYPSPEVRPGVGCQGNEGRAFGKLPAFLRQGLGQQNQLTGENGKRLFKISWKCPLPIRERHQVSNAGCLFPPPPGTCTCEVKPLCSGSNTWPPNQAAQALWASLSWALLEGAQHSPVLSRPFSRVSGNHQWWVARDTKNKQIPFYGASKRKELIFSLLLFSLRWTLPRVETPAMRLSHGKFILILEMNRKHVQNHTAISAGRTLQFHCHLHEGNAILVGIHFRNNILKKERRKIKSIIMMTDSCFSFVPFLLFVKCTPKTIRGHLINCFTPKFKWKEKKTCTKIKTGFCSFSKTWIWLTFISEILKGYFLKLSYSYLHQIVERHVHEWFFRNPLSTHTHTCAQML